MENGVMKVNCFWTGDGWKFLYYILLNHLECFDFSFYQSPHYRGVLVLQNLECFFQVPDDVIFMINSFTYIDDFPKFANILLEFSKHSPETHY
jgi:hypothetical protein